MQSSDGLPNLVQIGGYKCGSTTVASVLDQHPDVCISDIKEPQFFTYNWGKGIDWYRQTFSNHAGEKILGDASTSYSQFLDPPGNWGEPISRMRKTLGPDPKLLYVIRHPVDRLMSAQHYLLLRSMTDSTSLSNFVEDRPQHLETGRYMTHIRRYLEVFDRSQLKVVVIERLNENPAAAYRDILEFLEVDPNHQFASFSARNTSASRRKMPYWMTRTAEYMRRRPPLLKVYQVLRKPAESLLFRFGKKVPRPTVTTEEYNSIYEVYRPEIEALSEWLGEDMLSIWTPRIGE